MIKRISSYIKLLVGLKIQSPGIYLKIFIKVYNFKYRLIPLNINNMSDFCNVYIVMYILLF